MSGIFISYRRDDTKPWAGRLFDGLRRCFGTPQVFMDINGGIPRGANFEEALTDALQGCDALLALIGKAWLTCTGSDGSRRLDAPDDWVRKEIATALRRDVPLVPVLLGGATLPDEASLPQELKPLCKRNQAVVNDDDWNPHVKLLVEDLVKQTLLKQLRPLEDDVDYASTGIGALKELIASEGAVADAVSRSKEVIESSYRQVGRLDVLKSIHEALHTIEFECLRPLEAGPGSRLRPHKVRFSTEARRIRDFLKRNEIDPGLQDDIIDGIARCEQAFDAAVTTPGEAGFATVKGALNTLLSGLPSLLDAAIAHSARELKLDRLVELMGRVRLTLAAAYLAGLEPFLQGIEALQRLRDELSQRVREHAQLQRLESKLRTVCVGGSTPGTLLNEWGRIKKVRAQLVGPSPSDSPALAVDLAELESEIEALVSKGEEAALDLLQEYFRVVSSAFRDVDRGLGQFCMRLSAVSGPLKMVLDLLTR